MNDSTLCIFIFGVWNDSGPTVEFAYSGYFSKYLSLKYLGALCHSIGSTCRSKINNQIIASKNYL